MRISKQTKKTTLAQQGRYLLICLLSMLLLFLAGSVLILNRTQQQVYEQLEEISKLYTDELDHRFFRISRNLFSTVMDSSNPDSAFWKYMDLMEKDQYEEYVITQLRRNYVSAAWNFGTDYNVFLYTQKDESLYQLSISSDGLYAVDPYLQEALKRRIKSLSQQAYAVKKKWTVMCQLYIVILPPELFQSSPPPAQLLPEFFCTGFLDGLSYFFKLIYPAVF